MGGELVECHAGYAYGERPTALRWQGARLEIAQVEAAWRTEDGRRFRVRTRNGQVFEVLYSEGQDSWQVKEI